MSRTRPCPRCGSDMERLCDPIETEGYAVQVCHDEDCQRERKREDCCNADESCPECHPDCEKCNSLGFIGWGHCCDDCKGMGSLGWSASEIDNEMESRWQRSQEQAAQGSTGGTFSEQLAAARRFK